MLVGGADRPRQREHRRRGEAVVKRLGAKAHDLRHEAVGADEAVLLVDDQIARAPRCRAVAQEVDDRRRRVGVDQHQHAPAAVQVAEQRLGLAGQRDPCDGPARTTTVQCAGTPSRGIVVSASTSKRSRSSALPTSLYPARSSASCRAALAVAGDEAHRARALGATEAEQRGGDLRLVDRCAARTASVADLEDAGVVARHAVLVGQRRRAVEVEQAVGEVEAPRRENCSSRSAMSRRASPHLAVVEDGDADRPVEAGGDLPGAGRQREASWSGVRSKRRLWRVASTTQDDEQHQARARPGGRAAASRAAPATAASARATSAHPAPAARGERLPGEEEEEGDEEREEDDVLACRSRRA